MEYARHTIGSRNPLKRWLHSQRYDSSIRLLALASCHSVLDYGCGDGELTARIASRFPALRVVAYDPAEELLLQAKCKLARYPNVHVTQRIDAVTESFDRIACLETVEHLPPQQLERVLADIHRLLAPEGLCLITFPVEHGAISLIKNLYRFLTGRDPFVSCSRTVRSLFGIPVVREPERSLSGCQYIFSHVGFDCRAMIGAIGRVFSVRRVAVLPSFGFIRCGLGNGVAVIVGRKR